ncbi:hypothetical protein BKA70DRAFT_1444272 [Coprinopsis sp. MPI-PUGE-AT-0042]|nr:hypothetical protein BKA70DRAFT_1444272 [Coprinopsis sp. MPI-PUGE-AT-0042]
MLCLADRSRTYRAAMSSIISLDLLPRTTQEEPDKDTSGSWSFDQAHSNPSLRRELLAQRLCQVCQAHEPGESESDEGTDEGSEIQAGEVRLPDLGHGSLVKFKDLGVVNDAPNTDIKVCVGD